MTINARISCINKTPRYDPHLRISHVGGVNPDGGQWKASENDAIAGIERGEYSFFVTRGGHTARVIIATHNGVKYLKTENDGLQPDNLLSLPECP